MLVVMHKHNDTWSFADPPNVATITVRQITSRQQPILLVCHEEEDGTWLFLTGGAFNAEDSTMVSLRTILQLDSSVSALSDLPLGWEASRESPTHPWARAKSINTDA